MGPSDIDGAIRNAETAEMNDPINNIDDGKVILSFNSNGKPYIFECLDVEKMSASISLASTDYITERNRRLFARGSSKVELRMVCVAMNMIIAEKEKEKPFDITKEELEKLLRGDGV